MGTFLTTRKMAPALAARIERSVGATRGHGRGAAFAARVRITVFRFGVPFVIALGLYSVVANHNRQRRELERSRAALLEDVRKQSTLLSAEETGFVSRAEPWLNALAGPLESDLVADDLRAPKAIEATLARPLVYVRGPIAAFATAVGIASAAGASTKDSFILCLLDPPASRAEAVVLAKVRSAYAGSGLVEQRTEQARRLHDVDLGVKQSLVPWAERVRAARASEELSHIRDDLAKVPIESTKRAAKGELLIVAMDEPDEAGPADLDGERAHMVRVGVVDLIARRVVIRVRKRVDPSWMSAGTRASYAGAVDGCALAVDVREDVKR